MPATPEPENLEIATFASKSGPQAQRAAKDLIAAVHGRPIDDAVSEETAQRIARQRATAEAKDGIAAFLEKRKPVFKAR